jgi:hypothetical protein
VQADLPQEVQQLLLERVHSIEELEALLLLQSEPSRAWSDHEVAEALQVPERVVRSALLRLIKNGLCRSGGKTSGPTIFEPRTLRLEAAVRKLAEIYAERRVPILLLISRSAIARVRDDARRSFGEGKLPDRKGKND